MSSGVRNISLFFLFTDGEKSAKRFVYRIAQADLWCLRAGKGCRGLLAVVLNEQADLATA